MTAKLRAIDTGTRYDVIGHLRHFVRKIEAGEIAPRDVVLVTRELVKNNASCSVTLYHYGPGTHEDVHWMLSTAKNRMEPA